MTKIKEYSEEIPEEIRHAIRGLDSDYRGAIFVALYKHGELSFTALQKTLEIDKAMLSYHLGKLIESALVHHYYKHELGTEQYSFYNMTPFGQNFVETLGQILRPEPCPLTPSRDNSMTSGIFTTDWDIASRDFWIMDVKQPKETILDYIRSRLRADAAAIKWYFIDDTNIDVSNLVQEKDIVEKRGVIPSAV